MELHQLRYFVAAAEAGTISRAAERCHVSQPSMSQQIKTLETGLGVKLFDRVGRGVVLTDAGRALLPRARRVLAEVIDAEANLAREAEEGVRLAIGAIPTMAPYLLPAIAAGLRKHAPECELAIREDFTENLVEALIDNEIDVGIMSTPVDHDLIDIEVIGSEALLVVAPTRHPICGAREIGLAELRDQPTITLHEMHCLGKQISEFCAAKRLAKNVACRTAQLATVLELVSNGIGVSIVPTMAAQHDTSESRTYMTLKRTAPRRDIALAFRKGRTRPKLAERVPEILAPILDSLNDEPIARIAASA